VLVLALLAPHAVIQVVWAVLASPFRLARQREQRRIWAELARAFPGPERRGDAWSRDVRLAAVGQRDGRARLRLGGLADVSIPMRDAHDFSRKTRRRLEIPLPDG